MKYGRTAVALVTLFALTAVGGLATAKPPNKVTLCHNIKDTGTDGVGLGGGPVDVYEGTTIEVAQPAVSAHLAHGDLLGPCVHPWGYRFDDVTGDNYPEKIVERPY